MRSIKPLIFTLLVSIIFTNVLFCQIEDEFENKKPVNSLKDKIFFGGNLGLQFGTITQIDIAPVVGYKITPKISSGVGVTFSYYNNSIYKLNSTLYGGSIFARFQFAEHFFCHAEIEELNIDDYETFQGTNGNNYYEKYGRAWITSYLAGIGYSQPISERSFVYILLLWNINETSKSPYRNPVIRFGFNF